MDKYLLKDLIVLYCHNTVLPVPSSVEPAGIQETDTVSTFKIRPKTFNETFICHMQVCKPRPHIHSTDTTWETGSNWKICTAQWATGGGGKRPPAHTGLLVGSQHENRKQKTRLHAESTASHHNTMKHMTNRVRSEPM